MRQTQYGIDSDASWLLFRADNVNLDKAGLLIMHGSHATETVIVKVEKLSDTEAWLEWSDGVTVPAGFLLRRPVSWRAP